MGDSWLLNLDKGVCSLGATKQAQGSGILSSPANGHFAFFTKVNRIRPVTTKAVRTESTIKK